MKKVIVLYDNTRTHVAADTKDVLLELAWDFLFHPAYSPNLAPTNYTFFRSFHLTFASPSFYTKNQMQSCIDAFIVSKPTSFFKDVIGMLPNKWLKVIDANGQ